MTQPVTPATVLPHTLASLLSADGSDKREQSSLIAFSNSVFSVFFLMMSKQQITTDCPLMRAGQRHVPMSLLHETDDRCEGRLLMEDAASTIASGQNGPLSVSSPWE
jgi:hypothetical protein